MNCSTSRVWYHDHRSYDPGIYHLSALSYHQVKASLGDVAGTKEAYSRAYDLSVMVNGADSVATKVSSGSSSSAATAAIMKTTNNNNIELILLR